MRLALKVLAGFFLVVTMAQAACPPDRPYRCIQGPNGKQLCGCGY